MIYNENIINVNDYLDMIEDNVEYNIEFLSPNGIDFKTISNINDLFLNFGFYFKQVYENNNKVFNNFIKEYKNELKIYKSSYNKDIERNFKYNYKQDLQLDYSILSLTDKKLNFSLQYIEKLSNKDIKKIRSKVKFENFDGVRGKVLNSKSKIGKEDFKKEIINSIITNETCEIKINNDSLILLNKIKKYSDSLLNKAYKFCEDYSNTRKEYIKDSLTNKQVYYYVTSKVIEFREIARIYNSLLFTLMEIIIRDIKQANSILEEN